MHTRKQGHNVSVAMAAHNGERFIIEQIVSILPQLRYKDELVVSVDPSSDSTHALLEMLAQTYDSDASFRIIKGPGLGIAANFENALRACSGDIIFLADQDDIWMSDKVKTVLSFFAESDALLVCHDAIVVAEDLALLEPSYFTWHKSRKGLINNIAKNSFMGCCLAMRRELLDVALPFEQGIPMHDQWLGCIAEIAGQACFLSDPLILYRRHDTNASNTRHANIAQMISWRVNLLRSLRARLSR